MKYYTIHRGVDNEIEFRGLRGKHFYHAAICVIATLFLGLFLYMVGVPPLLTLTFLSVAGSSALWLIFRNNKRYGRWGAVKQTVRAHKPHFVCQYQSFGQLIPYRRFAKRTA
jgi:hypothetical protein